MLPVLPHSANNKVKKSTINWRGLNRKSLTADDEFSATTNLSSKNHPLVSPRDPREQVYSLTAGKALFAASKLAWADGTSFVYDGAVKGTVTATAKSMVELSQRIVVFPDKKSYDTVGGAFGAFGAGTYPAAGSVPDIDYACTLDNRIWGVKGDNIYCCALGDFDDWTSFLNPDGTVNEAGAWSVDTGTNGSFTGISSFKGTVVAFKNDRVWKLFGNTPSDFQFVEVSRLGCVSHKSACEVNNSLFWLSPQGVVAYTGGVPEVISENLNENYVSGVAGGDGRRYYLSLYNGSTYALYVFDTWKGVWLQEDDLHVTEMAHLGGFLYALTADNKVYRFGNGNERVRWGFATKEYTEEVSNKKGYSRIMFRVDLEAGSDIAVYTRTDNGSFTLCKAYSASDLSSFIVPLRAKNADHFQIKVEGNGEGKVHQLSRVFHYASE